MSETLTATGGEPGERGAAVGARAAIVAARRFAMGAEIARGGGGAIARARDRVLARDVAVKTPHDQRGAVRLRAEAAVLARLQHPSIVTVYDTGVHEDGLPFYAMKLVAGRSLREAIASAGSPSARIALLPHVIAVADAMAYAHAHGVIHRDLKPGNVLVGAFGETVVIDWGLAARRAPAGFDTVAPDEPGRDDPVDTFAPTSTSTGDVLGTPAYMPPEQARGERVDARADVYAIGAILYHLLSGAAPYAGETSARLPVLAGPPRPLSEVAPAAPADLVAIANRALARDPAERYPTAAELALDLIDFQTVRLVAARPRGALGRAAHWLRQRRVQATGVAIVVAAVAATVAWRLAASDPRAASCTGADGDVTALWSPARAAAVERAFAATRLSYAPTVARAAIARLDRHAAELAAAHVRQCSAVASPLSDRVAACLANQRGELAALVELFERPDAEVVDRAAELAASLAGPHRCEVPYLSAQRTAPAPDERAAELARRLVRLEIAMRVVRERDLTAEAEDIVVAARELDPCAVLGRALVVDGTYRMATAGTHDLRALARMHLVEAARVADGCGDDHARASALMAMLDAAVGSDLEVDLERSQRAALDAAAAIARVDDDALRARLAFHFATLAQVSGDLMTGVAFGELAAALGELTPEFPRFELADRLARLYLALGEIPRAEALATAARDEARARLGAHPHVAHIELAVAAVAQKRGDVATALASLGAARDILTPLRAPHHRDLLQVELAIAAATATDDATAAHDAFQRLLPIARTVLGKDHPLYLNGVLNHAQVAISRRDYDGARSAAEEVSGSYRHVLATNHPQAIAARRVLGIAHGLAGRHREAIDILEDVLRELDRKVAPEAPALAVTLDSLALALNELGQYTRAIPYFARAGAIRKKLGDGKGLFANRIGLATAMYELGEHEAARDLVQEALQTEDEPRARDVANRWLASHPARR